MVIMKIQEIDRYLINSSIQYYITPFFYCQKSNLDNCWLFVFIIYGLIPQIERILPLDSYNPSEEQQKQLKHDLKFKLPLYLSLVLDWLSMWNLLNNPRIYQLSYFNIIGLILGLGSLSTSNINISHELIHKDNMIDQFLGMLTLSKTMYMHFQIDHIKVHHKFVATPLDPSTAKLGQNLYSFLIQTILKNWLGSWQYENKRLAGQSMFRKLVNNKMIWFNLNNLIIPMIVYQYWGSFQLFIFLAVNLVSIVYFETVNYIEHYGLCRKEIRKGVYEKVDIRHSWNAPQRISNYILFKLQRHSDHHEDSSKPYQILCSYDQSPQMPHSYLVMVILALNPWQWFRSMDQYTMSYQKNQKVGKEVANRMKANVDSYINRMTVISFVAMLLGVII